MTTPPDEPALITYGCLHCERAIASVRARSFGFWYEARPQRPTISSERIVAGISGATPGSVATPGLDDDPKLKPVVSQPPKKTVSAATIARLATGRALRDLIMASPRTNSRPHRPAAKRKTSTGAMLLRHRVRS